jgi:hypothetical protein
LPQSYAVLFSGSAKIPMDLDHVVVDRFYHARDLFRAVNQLEDTVLIKSSSDWAQLVFENCQRFIVDHDFGIGVRKDMGTGAKRAAGVDRKEIGNVHLDAMDFDPHGICNDIPLQVRNHLHI